MLSYCVQLDEERKAKNAYKNEWYARNKERLRSRRKPHSREYMRKWRERHRERLRDKHLRWRTDNPDNVRDRRYVNKYGLTTEGVRALLEEQGGRCAICDRELSIDAPYRAPDKANIDHDHMTGRVRGVLCRKCNGSLGVFGDTVEGLMHVVAYLKRGSDG